jgi:hypothetical protein
MLVERKTKVMKLNSVLLVGLVSIGLLTFGADSAWRLLLGRELWRLASNVKLSSGTNAG